MSYVIKFYMITIFICAMKYKNILTLKYGKTKKHEFFFSTPWHQDMFNSLLTILSIVNQDLYSLACSDILVVVDLGCFVILKICQIFVFANICCSNIQHSKISILL